MAKSTDASACVKWKAAHKEDDCTAFRDIFENANIGIFQSTLEGRYLLINPALAKMYGYDSVEEMLNVLTDISQQLYVEEGKRDVFVNTLMETGTIENFESQVYRRDGSIIWISETARVVSATGAHAAYFEGFVENITVQKNLEQRVADFTNDLENRVQKRTSELLLEIERRRLAELSLKQALKKAETATEAKSMFLASMSHELRTPLNAIIGFAEAMMAKIHGPIAPSPYVEYVEIIKGSGDHLLSLINDILDLSKINSGSVDLDMAPVNVRDVMMDCLLLIAHRAEEGRVQLITQIDEKVDATIHGDARRIKQVFLNLLSNAIKFTPEQGSVTVSIIDCAPGLLAVSFKDTGVGIAAQDIAHVLSEYGQAEHGLDHVAEGTGLGLPISKKLVELHGGSLNLESQVGRGTTLTVTFPV